MSKQVSASDPGASARARRRWTSPPHQVRRVVDIFGISGQEIQAHRIAGDDPQTAVPGGGDFLASSSSSRMLYACACTEYNAASRCVSGRDACATASNCRSHLPQGPCPSVSTRLWNSRITGSALMQAACARPATAAGARDCKNGAQPPSCRSANTSARKLGVEHEAGEGTCLSSSVRHRTSRIFTSADRRCERRGGPNSGYGGL